MFEQGAASSPSLNTFGRSNSEGPCLRFRGNRLLCVATAPRVFWVLKQFEGYTVLCAWRTD